MVKPKSYLDFIAEDKSLTKKITLEEFENNEFAPENSDETIEEAYAAYKRVMEKLNGWGIDVELEKFTEIFDENVLPEIHMIRDNNPLITIKNIDLCREEIYREYIKLNTLYKEQIFNKSEKVLLDRHKVAACICGAFLKVSVFKKDALVASLRETRQMVDPFFFYVNEFIAFIAATKFLSYFMVLEKEKKEDYEAAGEIINKFPLLPPVSNSKLGFWGITLYNLSQIKVYAPTDSAKYSIGLEHYDIYSYAMYFYWMELYYKMVQNIGKNK